MDSHADKYEGYLEWKKWDSISEPEKSYHEDLFDQELARLGVPSETNFLEVGFGPGLFLDWAKAAGHQVVGVEVQRELIEAAAERDHEVVSELDETFIKENLGRFEVVVMFDVLEHYSAEEIPALFRSCSRVLCPGGLVLARFPNGISPFGRYHQHGDSTHKSVLSPPLVEQLARGTGLAVVGVFNAARSRLGGKSGRSKKRLAYALRGLIQKTLGYAYYGEDMPMDPNVSVVLANDRGNANRQ